jgi:hypothetical protein
MHCKFLNIFELFTLKGSSHVWEIWDGFKMSSSSEILKDVKMHKPKEKKEKKGCLYILIQT